jgi:hypothetical protein
MTLAHQWEGTPLLRANFDLNRIFFVWGISRQDFDLQFQHLPAQSREWAGVQPQSITRVIETQGVHQLGVEQSDDLAPRTERAGVVVDALSRASLGTDAEESGCKACVESRTSWPLAGGFDCSCPTLGQSPNPQANIFILQPSTLWDSNEIYS